MLATHTHRVVFYLQADGSASSVSLLPLTPGLLSAVPPGSCQLVNLGRRGGGAGDKPGQPLAHTDVSHNQTDKQGQLLGCTRGLIYDRGGV